MRRRAIHEVALTSKSLARVSDFAERLFWRLILIANSKGEFVADPQLVAARCFPMMLEQVNGERVRVAMNELRDAGSIKRLNGTGVFVNWQKYQPQRPVRERYKSDAPGAVVTFTLGGGFVLDEQLIEVWSRSYPGISIANETGKAHAWVIAGWPSTKRDDPRRGGWRVFLNNWLRRAYKEVEEARRTITLKRETATAEELEAARRLAAEADQVLHDDRFVAAGFVEPEDSMEGSEMDAILSESDLGD